MVVKVIFYFCFYFSFAIVIITIFLIITFLIIKSFAKIQDFIASFLNIVDIVKGPFINLNLIIPFITTFTRIHLNQLKIIIHFNQQLLFFLAFDFASFDIIPSVVAVLNFSLILFYQIRILFISCIQLHGAKLMIINFEFIMVQIIFT